MLDPSIFNKNDDYFECLGSSLWLMDNHKWALCVWERSCIPGIAYTLVHADYHWDAIYDFAENSSEENVLLEASCEQLESLIRREINIQYDSFIVPAVARGLLDEIHFLCFQKDSDEGVYQPILDKFGCTQSIHRDSKELRSLKAGEHLLFDLDLDIFNRSEFEYGSELWSDTEIEIFLDDCKELVQSASVVTISMLYGCSGTPDDTRVLTERVVPLFLEWRNISCQSQKE
jgi:hypothetical protein